MGEVIGFGEGGGADAVDEGDGGAGVGDGEAVACEGVFVDFGMQVAKAIREFDLFAIHGDGTEGGFSFCLYISGEVIVIHREEPAHTCIFKLDYAGHAFGIIIKDFAILHGSEQPHDQVEEMDADIGGDPAGFILYAFPGGVIPGTA